MSRWYVIFALEQVNRVFQLTHTTLNKVVALDINSTNNKFIVASNNDNKRLNNDNKKVNKKIKINEENYQERLKFK